MSLLSCTKNHDEQIIQTQSSLKPCSKEAKLCANGHVVGRNPANNCKFDSCEQIKNNSKKLCTADVKQCADGTFVGRDASNNCQFPACADRFN